jgi:hypothetical protein
LKNNSEGHITPASDTSDASDRKQRMLESEPTTTQAAVIVADKSKNFKCFYCDECFGGKDGSECNIKRIDHMDIEHPGKPHYPSEDAFNNRLEK